MGKETLCMEAFFTISITSWWRYVKKNKKGTLEKYFMCYQEHLCETNVPTWTRTTKANLAAIYHRKEEPNISRESQRTQHTLHCNYKWKVTGYRCSYSNLLQNSMLEMTSSFELYDTVPENTPVGSQLCCHPQDASAAAPSSLSQGVLFSLQGVCR